MKIGLRVCAKVTNIVLLYDICKFVLQILYTAGSCYIKLWCAFAWNEDFTRHWKICKDGE